MFFQDFCPAVYRCGEVNQPPNPGWMEEENMWTASCVDADRQVGVLPQFYTDDGLVEHQNLPVTPDPPSTTGQIRARSVAKENLNGGDMRAVWVRSCMFRYLHIGPSAESQVASEERGKGGVQTSWEAPRSSSIVGDGRKTCAAHQRPLPARGRTAAANS